MPHFRTLTARFGTLYASLLAIVAGVCLVSFVQLAGIHRDSQRVMEETREQSVLVSAIAGLNSIEGLLDNPGSVGEDDLSRARALVERAALQLRGLEDFPEDPSREEHQVTEAGFSDRIQDDLRHLLALLDDPARGDDLEQASERLVAIAGDAGRLQAEANEEAHEAILDLDRRASSMRYVMVATVVAASLLLGLALATVQVGVVRPLRVLRGAAERFGEGNFDHRVHIKNSDEMGDLASSLDRMADELAESHEHLEQRVRSRTREFLRAARLADLGLLASGIAHELNTPLASIASCGEGLQRRLREDALSKELLTDYSSTICREVYRARGITTRMLALVREEPSALATVSLRIILDQAESALTHRAQRARVQLVRRADDERVELNVNGGELVQIIVNLLANAIDASLPGSSVVLSAQIDGKQLTLSVEDNGSGIREEDLEQVFEPFFTTKPSGQGTGLGLALVGTMVESHRGHVSVESERGRGTTFRVVLPRDWSQTT